MLSAILDSFHASLRHEEVAYASPSLALCQDRTVERALGAKPVFCLPYQPMVCRSMVGWGRKSGHLAARMARRRGTPVLLLEDGFMRSFRRNDPSLSVVLDDLGIYYDAHGPSRLEGLISTPLEGNEAARIEAILKRWRDAKLSKYNDGREFDGPLPDRYVLVIDQVRHDASIGYGMADGASFQRMFAAACAENPGLDIVVKMHPDVFTRSRAGHFDVEQLRQMPNVHVIAEGCLPSHLIEKAIRVYTVTSQMGFEALIWGKPVRCFGMPFYAGWGLTDDFLDAPERRQKASFLQLAMAALIRYPRYIDLETGATCEIERAIDYLTELKQKALIQY
nr:hypothetical protein [uncultured Cohaesibacter sp.]